MDERRDGRIKKEEGMKERVVERKNDEIKERKDGKVKGR